MRIPTKATLRKYGWSEDDWRRQMFACGQRCAICGRPDDVVTLVIDHVHVRGFKRMSPGQKRIYVRGTPCRFCNRVMLQRGVTLERARAVVAYLEKYEGTRDA